MIHLDRNQLSALLRALPRVRVGVIGDFCLDIYWEIDLSAAETSVETGLSTRPVRVQRYALGGAGTIVNNLVALGVHSVTAFGVVGDDPFGRELERLLAALGLARDGLLRQPADWQTPAYLKPIRDGREEQRLDFGNFNRLADEVATTLLAKLSAALLALDVVIVNEQILRGIHTPCFQEGLNRQMADQPGKVFIADSRHLAGAYHQCLQRLNQFEAIRLCGATHPDADPIGLEEVRAAAAQLFANARQPVFVSRGADGVVVADASGVQVVSGLRIDGPTDPVGAGDSMLAGIAAALAAGYEPVQAATFGNLVAAVTVQKLFQTGTASPEEILAIAESPQYRA